MILSKESILTDLKDVFRRWEELLAQKDEADLIAPRLSSERSIKDVIAHLHAWQLISIADVEAALHGRDKPNHPAWLGDADPFYAEDHLPEFNERIRAEHAERPWSDVCDEWREGFRHLLAVSESISEDVFLERGRYSWLRGHPLIAVLRGSLEHHREHLESAAKTR